ncbi:NHL repeat-containing protein [Paenibacillaceae sp. P-4]|uniref:LVIVD repeat-containing protein n=1 Tax=Paenibacillaceae bacterium P-4 TaxID=3160969 RepID=UPI0032E84A79
MSIEAFQRLVSNATSVFVGTNIDQAALNAANGTGTNADQVARTLAPVAWPLLEKYDNDNSLQAYSPFGGVPNPEYVWKLPVSDGQTSAFAAASAPFLIPAGASVSFSLFLNAFADNAMEARIEIFEDTGGAGTGPFAKSAVQPAGLDDFFLMAGDPNMPALGLLETQPYNWQDIRVYSTRCLVSGSPTAARTFKIVVSFHVTNYLVMNPPNPAGLQFAVDMYADGPDYLYVSNVGDKTVEIYNIANPASPVRIGQFNGGNLNNPRGMAITGTTLYVANAGSFTVSMYNAANPTAPLYISEFNGANLSSPHGLAITGTTLYIANRGDDTIEIYNIVNPTSPAHVTEFGSGDLHRPEGLAITGTTLYVANQNDGTVEIYDIANPTAPVRVTEFGSGDLSEPVGLAITGTTLYVANQGNSTIEIYNITNPIAPVRITEFGSGEVSEPAGMAITGITLYVANQNNSTVEIYNISTPTAPVHAGQFNGGNVNQPYGLVINSFVG